MNELILKADQAITIPSGNGQSQPLVFDMRRIYKAESRLFEINGITRLKAGELLHTMIEAWGDAKSFLATLNTEFNRAKQRVRSIRGIVVLDRAPETLKVKGLTKASSPAGSEDLRDSVVNNDPEYLVAVDRVYQIEAEMDMMEGRTEKLKMAYFSINKLIEPFDMTKKDTSGVTGDDEAGALGEREQVQQFVSEHSVVRPVNYGNGFGSPKY